MKNPRITRTIAGAMLGASLCLPAQAHADWRDVLGAVGTGVTMGFDVLVVRPLGLIGIAIGAGAFVPVALITSPNGRDGLEEATDIFIMTPVNYVFTREIGDL
jgi:hypothetical protein